MVVWMLIEKDGETTESPLFECSSEDDALNAIKFLRDSVSVEANWVEFFAVDKNGESFGGLSHGE